MFTVKCDHTDCFAGADVLVYEPGYPAPMIRACFDHLGWLIRKDRVSPCSSEDYELVVCHPEHGRTMPPMRT